LACLFTSDTHGREQVADLPPLFNRAARFSQIKKSNIGL
jgi:hypothetical protein